MSVKTKMTGTIAILAMAWDHNLADGKDSVACVAVVP